MSRKSAFSGLRLLALGLSVAWALAPTLQASPSDAPGSADALAGSSGLWLARVAPAPAPEAAPEGAVPEAAAAPEPPDQGPTAIPPATAVPPASPPSQGLYAMLLGRGPQAGPSPRLAGVPNMFGDFFGLGGTLVSTDPDGFAQLPLAAASRRVKVAENNKALPMDRVHFIYNHFHQALEYTGPDLAGDPVSRVFDVDRFTIAVEKTLFGGLYSVEVRMPFAGEIDFNPGDFSVSGGDIGNLAVLLKRSLWQTRTSAAVIGLAVDLPTGSDVTGHARLFEYTLHNEAVHVGPFAGLLWAPDHRRFAHAFLQVDVPANGNSVTVDNTQLTASSFHEQTAMYLDLGVGYWVYRNPRAWCLTGVAGLLEVHYATTLSDFGTLFFDDQITTLTFGNSAGGVDEVNLTVGVHGEFARNTLLRVAGVFPLREDDDRFFDSEIQVQVERRF